MPRLVAPSADVRESFLTAMAEFAADGGGGPDDHSSIGDDLRSARWASDGGFEGYVQQVLAEALPETPRPPDRVACTTLWWVDGDEYLGRLAIRHELSPWLRDYGGHIGYAVRPSARRQGHAGAMLRASLPVAFGLGIDPALLTCDDTNVVSRRIIEGAGGVFEDQRADKLRFWLATSA